MKSFFVLPVLFFTVMAVHAQHVLTSSGNSGFAADYRVDWTLGEPVIETLSGSHSILTQGLHQTKLLVTAINDIDLPGLEVKVYPNPTGRFINLEIIQSGNEQFLYELTDITGRKSVLKQMDANSEEIDMGSHAPGMYFIRIVNAHNRIVKVCKIIKNY